MKNLTLEHIAAACHGTYYGSEEKKSQCIEAVTTDSRKVERGCLFVPIVGARADGHKFIDQVMKQGALATLSERPLGEVDFPYIQVESSLQAVKDLAAYYLEQLQIPVVGITGSVGKTSTKEMIASVLEQKYKVLKTAGNFNNEIGLPLTIFRIHKEHEVAVLEMGISDFGEMNRLAGMAKPDICVITNIGLCHLENLGTRDGILAAKTEVFDHMQPEGTVILNGDDDKLCTKQRVNGRPAIFYGVDAEPKKANTGEPMAEKSIYATDIENLGLEGMRALIHTPEGEFTALIPLPGEHNVYNALAGTAVGLQLGLSLEEIGKGIASVQTIAGRSNLIEAGGMRIIDDCYNANPVSMKASIEVLAHTKGRKIAVLGDMGELGADERKLHYGVGEALAQSHIDVLFAAGELAAEYVSGAAGADCEMHYYPTVEEMIPELVSYVTTGDTILVKASHFMNFPKVVEALQKSVAE